MAGETEKKILAYVSLAQNILQNIVLKIIKSATVKAVSGIVAGLSLVSTGIGIIIGIVQLIISIGDYLGALSDLKKARNTCYYMYRRIKRLLVYDFNKVVYKVMDKSLDYAEKTIGELYQTLKNNPNNVLMTKKYFVINEFNSFILYTNIISWLKMSNTLQTMRNGMFLDYIYFVKVNDYIDTHNIFEQDKIRIQTFIFDNNIDMLNVFAINLEELQGQLNEVLKMDLCDAVRSDTLDVLDKTNELLAMFSSELLENLKNQNALTTKSVSALFNSIFRYMDYGYIFENSKLKNLSSITKMIYPTLDLNEYCVNIPEYPLYLLKDYFVYFGNMIFNDIYIDNYIAQIKTYASKNASVKALYLNIIDYLKLTDDLVNEFESYIFCKNVLSELKNGNYKKLYDYYLKVYKVNDNGNVELVTPAQYTYSTPNIETYKTVIKDIFKANNHLKNLAFGFYDAKSTSTSIQYKNYYDNLFNNITYFKEIVKAFKGHYYNNLSYSTEQEQLLNYLLYGMFTNYNVYPSPDDNVSYSYFVKTIDKNSTSLNWTNLFNNRGSYITIYKYTVKILTNYYTNSGVTKNKLFKNYIFYSIRSDLTESDFYILENNNKYSLNEYCEKLNNAWKNVTNRPYYRDPKTEITYEIYTNIDVYQRLYNYILNKKLYPYTSFCSMQGYAVNGQIATKTIAVDWDSVLQNDLIIIENKINEVYKMLIYPEISNPDYISIFSAQTVTKENQYIFNLFSEILNLKKSNVGYLLKQSIIIPIYSFTNVAQKTVTGTTTKETVYFTATVNNNGYLDVYKILKSAYDRVTLYTMFYKLNERAINQLFAYATGNFENKLEMYNYYKDITADYTDLIFEYEKTLNDITTEFNNRMKLISPETIYRSFENDIINQELNDNLQDLEIYRKQLEDKKKQEELNQDNNNNGTTNTDSQIDIVDNEIKKTETEINEIKDDIKEEPKQQTEKKNSNTNLITAGILGIIGIILLKGGKKENGK